MNDIVWKTEPLKDSPEKFWGLLVIILASIPISYLVTHSVVLTLLAPTCIVASTSEFLLGKKFSLTSESASAGLSTMKWSEIKLVQINESNINLSPFSQESRLDAVRGVKLSLQNVNREEVLNFIRFQVGQDVRFLGE